MENKRIIEESLLKISTNSENKKSHVIAFIIAVFSVFALNIQFDKASNWLGFVAKDAFSLVILMFIVGIYLLVDYSLKIKNKRLTICSAVLGGIFAVTYFMGYLGETYITTTIPTSKKFLLFTTLKLIFYFIIFSTTVKVMIFNLDKIRTKNLERKEKRYRFFSNNKKSLMIIAVLFFISYIPYILYYYPGTIFYDNIQSLLQITGKIQYNNFQPIFYTLIYGGLWNLGKAIFGFGNAGILLYTLFQALFASITFSILLYYMAKRDVSIKWRVITLLLLILNPVIGMFVVRGEKGLIFHLSLILFVIGIIDIFYEKEKFFKKIWKPILFTLVILFMAFIRNNGFYVFVLTIPFILIFIRKDKKLLLKTFIMLFIPLISIFIIQGPIFKLVGIGDTLSKEMFSIPAQQIGRIIKYEGNNLSEDDKNEISKYMKIDYEIINKEYMPELSDNMKALIDEEALKKDKIGFIKLYFKLAFKYPVHTIAAFIDNTFAYYAANATYIGGLSNYNDETKDVLTNWYRDENPNGITNYEEYDYYPQHLIDLDIFNFINTELSWKRIPLFSILFTGIGFYFWILLFIAIYYIYKKEYYKITILLPVFWLWLTNIAGPVVDIRYIFSIILIMPLLIGITFGITKNKDINNNDEKIRNFNK